MDSQRQSCQAPKCCVENSDLVTAAGDGDLEKVRALAKDFKTDFFSISEVGRNFKFGDFLVV